MTLVGTTSGGKTTTDAKADGAESAVMDSYRTDSGRSRLGSAPTPIEEVVVHKWTPSLTISRVPAVGQTVNSVAGIVWQRLLP
ncbi:unnamed protein product [Phytophthora lilii]|uniref:Unnamed protein product n=1 Tax=Phytophthora lilii TaxID=2077276 RepID=A0A9W6U3V2_9STRA|nr:unnamed protein product [Phytophthora lilii]